MKQSRLTRLNRVFLLKAMLLATLVVPALGVPAFCQQEVDPAWYDPWAGQAKVVVQPARPRVRDHKTQRKVSSITPNRRAQRSRAKRSASTAVSRAKDMGTTETNRF